MTVLDAYLANYDRIAADHVAHWRKTGLNPFQTPEAVKANEDITVDLIGKYVPSGSQVLDAGCGMGDLMHRLRYEYEMCGVEIAGPYREVAHERGLRVIPAMIEYLTSDLDRFDAVIATDVLEHVIDLHAATKELLRVLKPGGHIIVRVPNAEPVSWTEAYDFVHLRILDEGTLRILFSRIFGCEVKETLIQAGSLHLVAQK